MIRTRILFAIILIITSIGFVQSKDFSSCGVYGCCINCNQGGSSSVTISTTTINSNFTNFTQLLDSGFTSYTGLNDLCLVINETLGKIQARSCSSSSGDITSVTAGTGLLGGGLTGAVTLNVSASTCSAGELSKYNGTGFVCVTDSTGSGNASWNESYANTKYSSIIWNYNQTTPAITFSINNFNYTNMFNNLTSSDCPAGLLVIGVQNNGTVLCATDSQGSANSSWNQSYADTLYSPILWGYNQTTPFTNWLATFLFNYNQTTPAIADINNRFWNITQSWNRTQLYNITQINNMNASWIATFNTTYQALLGQQCATGSVVNGTLANGTIICTTVQTGSFVTDQINNNLNITANVSFAKVSINNLNITNTTGTSSSSFLDNGTCTIWKRGANQVALCG